MVNLKSLDINSQFKKIYKIIGAGWKETCMMPLLDDNKCDRWLIVIVNLHAGIANLVHFPSQHDRKLSLGDAIAKKHNLVWKLLVSVSVLHKQLIDHLVKVVNHFVRLAFWCFLRIQTRRIKATIEIQAAGHRCDRFGQFRVGYRGMCHVSSKYHHRSME